MGARGPKFGCGENTQKVLMCLFTKPRKASKPGRTCQEIHAATDLEIRTIYRIINRLLDADVVETNETRRSADRLAPVYVIKEGVELAQSIKFRSRKHRVDTSSAAVRGLGQFFLQIATRAG